MKTTKDYRYEWWVHVIYVILWTFIGVSVVREAFSNPWYIALSAGIAVLIGLNAWSFWDGWRDRKIVTMQVKPDDLRRGDTVLHLNDWGIMDGDDVMITIERLERKSVRENSLTSKE